MWGGYLTKSGFLNCRTAVKFSSIPCTPESSMLSKSNRKKEPSFVAQMSTSARPVVHICVISSLQTTKF